MSIEQNYYQIKEEISQICGNNGIGQAVTIIAVTKNQSADVIPVLEHIGVRDFAENRVQALCERAPLISGTRHLIGHLQTNKVKKALECADLIHSVDSFRLAQEISRCAENSGKTAEILIQVNVAKEPQKYGVYTDDLDKLICEVAKLSHIRIRGLMAIMPIDTKDEYYRTMYELYQYYANEKPYGTSIDLLSMGMSNDYAIAVRSGSNMVRIGTALYR